MKKNRPKELNLSDVEIGTVAELSPSELDVARFVCDTMDVILKDTPHHAGFQLAGSRLMGIQAEMAYCKMANVYPLSFDMRNLGKYDLIHSGYRVDVKSTEGKDMTVNEKQGNGADVYILMIRKGNRFEFMGRISSKRLMEYPLREMINNSKARVIPAKDLV